MNAASTPSEPHPDELRERLGALRADRSRRGRRFGEESAATLDDWFTSWFPRDADGTALALVALGSYARGELTPGSDVDLLLVLQRDTPASHAVAESCWYPAWDAGLRLGHRVGTVRQLLALANDDLDTLTALLDARLVVGDAALVEALQQRVRDLAARRGNRIVAELAAAFAARAQRAIAEMLAPDLKNGGGGLRDAHALSWAGWTLGLPGGIDALVATGRMSARDARRLRDALDVLLDVRVALHRTAKSRSDVLAIQEQDDVAALLGIDALDLMRDLASAARVVTWLGRDVFDQFASAARGPLGRLGRGDRVLAPGVVLRDRRIVATGPVDIALVLRAARAAAEAEVPFARSFAAAAAEVDGRPAWDAAERRDLLALLNAGRPAIDVIESLDHIGVLTRVLPEWEAVRSHPQRNAYHRFTVDRHLLEALAELATLRRGDTPEAEVARRLEDPDALTLAVLLHDIAKPSSGDHSEIGADVARAFVTRIGGAPVTADRVAWLVRHHLDLADVAARRDLRDPAVIEAFAAHVGSAERLRALYLHTIADSRATGPAAWSPAKAALLGELFERTERWLEHGPHPLVDREERRTALEARLGPAAGPFLEGLPTEYLDLHDVDAMVQHQAWLAGGGVECDWQQRSDGQWRVSVGAPNRPGLLADIAGALALTGFEVHSALVATHAERYAIDEFSGADAFGRLATPEGRTAATRRIEEAVAGEIDLGAALADMRRRYRGRAEPARPGPIRVRVAADASARATVLEVHADDERGLLARTAAVLTDLGLDVDAAKVDTLGRRVVDVFWVRRPGHGPVDDPGYLERVRATIFARLTTEFSLPDRT